MCICQMLILAMGLGVYGLFFYAEVIFQVQGLGLSTRMVASSKWVSSRCPVVCVVNCLHETASGLCFLRVGRPQPSLVNASK